MNLITSNDIRNFGSYSDRKNCFDDNMELDVAVKFINNYCDDNDVIKKKPYGRYGVDIGVFDGANNLKYAVDVERWSKWNDDWPQNYKHLSFLGRKDKFLNHGQFAMMFFNYDLTKLIRIIKNDIIKVSREKRFTQGKFDIVRKVPFKYGKLYGTNLTEREMSIFDYEVCKL